ncbi:lipid A export permease/ATP-binding protein MsbA [Paraferrimonas sp. SM1919]|uniref:lipid A export permease/ATP-binding protein MsbA n=1 Tax=Paraferrimonas sp. SM1919 TaxID=2662263 RepID=UPI0013D00D01|nr:lipid A export permease/ATP-binding protein MsbA [Paraferrimonas sp. SM1919]
MSSSQNIDTWPVFKRLMGYVAPLKGVLIVAIIALIIYGLVDALFIAFLQPFIDEGFNAGKSASGMGAEVLSAAGLEQSNRLDVLAIAPFVVIGMFIIRGLANFVSSYSLAHLSNKIIMIMRQQVFEHYLKLPVGYIDNHSTGSLISHITYDTEQIARAAGNALITIVRDGISVIAYVAIMLYLSWKLTLSIVVIAPIIGLIIVVVSRRFRKVSKQIQNAMGEVTSATEQMVSGHKNVLMFGGQKVESDRFYQVNDRNRSRNMKLALAQSISQPLIMIIGSLALAAVLYAASMEGLKEELSAGTFASMIAAMLAMLQPIKNLTRVNAEFQRGITACATVFELLDSDVENDKGKHKVEQVKGNIGFNQVSFSYPGAEGLTLNGINFEAKAGQTIALVGPSGSGKSTITQLLTRFYDELASGHIELDGVDIKDFDLKNLRSHIALVSQQVTLFNGSIADNIAYAYPGKVTQAQIIQAATAAHVMEFVENLPEGLDTQIGENGVLLSGGQRQRIAIARAILRDAPILILDEATSALDTESERAIQDALNTLLQNRTSIVVAHRLSTIENADNILVIEQGKLTEQGTHNQLLEQNGRYAKLYQMQFGE